MKTYFAVDNSLFMGDCTLRERQIDAQEARLIVADGVLPVVRDEHGPILRRLAERFLISVELPVERPRIDFAGPTRVLMVESAPNKDLIFKLYS